MGMRKGMGRGIQKGEGRGKGRGWGGGEEGEKTWYARMSACTCRCLSTSDSISVDAINSFNRGCLASAVPAPGRGIGSCEGSSDGGAYTTSDGSMPASTNVKYACHDCAQHIYYYYYYYYYY